MASTSTPSCWQHTHYRSDCASCCTGTGPPITDAEEFVQSLRAMGLLHATCGVGAGEATVVIRGAAETQRSAFAAMARGIHKGAVIRREGTYFLVEFPA